MTAYKTLCTRLVLLLLGLSLGPSCGRMAARDTPLPEDDRKDTLSRAEVLDRTTPTPSKKVPDRTTPTPVVDKGIFSDLDHKVVLRCPSWLDEGPHQAIRSTTTGRTWLAIDGVIVCETPDGTAHENSALPVEGTPQDHDQDGVPDAVDILRGARKAALNGATYRNNYRPLAFPWGDVPRDEGVCTDVVIRSLRNTGLDLQELVSRDIAARPDAYPMVKKPDPHIDHRRVRTLLPYFESALESLPTSPNDNAFPYLPGDIILMNTIGDKAPEHLGIVSDELGESGLPLIINNWTEGTVTRPMDLLQKVPVTHRFRAARPLRLGPEQEGLDGVLKRQDLSVPEETKQVLLVTTPLWTSSGGTLQRFQRTPQGFAAAGGSVPVRIGSRGLGAGRGAPNTGINAPAPKQEGDKKAPAGVFHLGTAFGRAAKAPYEGNGWPYRKTTAKDFWSDDPNSPRYNEWFTLGDGEILAESAERLRSYTLGLVVLHNTQDTVKGAGSAIFLHPWRNPETPTVGCTALAEDDLIALLAWLDEESRPVLIQVAEHVY